MSDQGCRCGWDGKGDHPCHGKGYTCGKPGTPRFVTYLTCLAGVQPKVGAYDTIACDECWEDYKRTREEWVKKNGREPMARDVGVR